MTFIPIINGTNSSGLLYDSHGALLVINVFILKMKRGKRDAFSLFDLYLKRKTTLRSQQENIRAVYGDGTIAESIFVSSSLGL